MQVGNGREIALDGCRSAHTGEHPRAGPAVPVTALDSNRLAGGHGGHEVTDGARLGRQGAMAVLGAPGLEQAGVALKRAPGIAGIAVGADFGMTAQIAHNHRVAVIGNGGRQYGGQRIGRHER
jgi:hypothetical protein